MIPYLLELETIENFFEEFKKQITDCIFRDSKTNDVLEKPDVYHYCWTPIYQQFWKVLYGIVSICDMFGIRLLEHNKSLLMERVTILNSPESITQRKDFEYNVNLIRNVFKDAEGEIKKKLHLLDRKERYRLEEAINCYMNGCKYSTVAMSVSAIEFRLLNLMQSAKPDFGLEKSTLGELINEYLRNKKEYKNVIPKKHEALLNLCNTYRIFSVHPKKEIITQAIATSIINMTFAFLLDEKLKKKAETK